jgi:hypothetical protein
VLVPHVVKQRREGVDELDLLWVMWLCEQGLESEEVWLEWHYFLVVLA